MLREEMNKYFASTFKISDIFEVVFKLHKIIIKVETTKYSEVVF